ncbi:hypothetical protein PHISCL_03446 [Aspergillus sclerotialis]|uniref:Uncharacterized protein n=1 Tax=Aspergillus sclerotialis TaxID=2070753 RepID=A0A3A2ZMK5_9EURO|nr:hypothetical protein PHISCL_03446 [Aspergillus sclerotialis]
MFIFRDVNVQSLKRSDDVSPSSRNQIIIGVVVGGVVFIAITAGVILFFHFRKRKRNHSTTKRDQQLLPVQIPPAYKATSVIYPSIPPEQRASQSYSQSYAQEGRSESEQPPAYQPPLPTYDPSKYQNVDRPISTMEISRENIGGPRLNPVYYPDPRMSFQPMDDRLTIQRLSGETSVEHGRRPSDMSSFRGTASLEWPRPSMQSSETARSNGMTRPLSFDESDEACLSRPLDEENRPPRRPKPTLSRLITNFG